MQKRPRPPATRGELRVPHARHACHRGTTLIARDDEGAGARRVLAEGVAAFSITRDGRHVIFHPSGASDQRPVFSVPVDGGAPVWVADNVGDVVTAGPAGERIAIGAPGPVCDLGADLGPGSGLDSGCGPLSAVRLEGPRRGEAIALADEAQLLAVSSLSGRILYDAWAPDGSHEVRLATPLERAPGDALVLLARAKTSHALNVITSQSVTGWMSDDGTRVVLQASTNTTTWGGDWGGTAVEVTDLRLLELDPPSVTAPRVRSDITLPLLHVEGLAVAGALLRDSAPSGETRFWLHTGTSPATLVADLSSPPNTTQKISPSSWVLDPRSPNAHVTLLDLTLPPAEAARPLTHGGEFARPLGDWLVVYDLPGGDEGKAVFYAYDPRTTRYARFPVGHAPLGIVAGGAGVVGWTLSSSDAIWIAPTPEWR